MRVTIGQLEFTRTTDTSGPFPYLISVGTLRVQAGGLGRSGLGVGESTNLEIVLANNERQAAAVLGNPLRQPVTVKNDDGSIFFQGIVSRAAWGRTVTLSLGS